MLAESVLPTAQREKGGEVRRFFAQLIEGGGGNFHESAVGIGKDIGRAGTVVEQGNVAEKFTDA